MLSSYCLHQMRVCLSLARLTTDVNIKQRCEDVAMDFVGRIGGKDDCDMAELRGDRHASIDAR